MNEETKRLSSWQGGMNNTIRLMLEKELCYVQCGNSNVGVASVLIAQDRNGNLQEFTGANIELAGGIYYHAEEVALIKAISEGYIKPIHVYLTSPSKKHQVPMCLICRGKYSYVNIDCSVTVLDSDFKPVLTVSVRNSVNYPYFGRGYIS